MLYTIGEYAIGGIVLAIVAYSAYYRIKYGKTASQTALAALEAKVAALEAKVKL